MPTAATRRRLHALRTFVTHLPFYLISPWIILLLGRNRWRRVRFPRFVDVISIGLRESRLFNRVLIILFVGHGLGTRGCRERAESATVNLTSVRILGWIMELRDIIRMSRSYSLSLSINCSPSFFLFFFSVVVESYQYIIKSLCWDRDVHVNAASITISWSSMGNSLALSPRLCREKSLIKSWDLRRALLWLCNLEFQSSGFGSSKLSLARTVSRTENCRRNSTFRNYLAKIF